ncbi:MAG TPA: hypothetical protein VMB02_16775 [Candidatus Aquilonibacter sp.]|nr:hypothetical protein [Candidatus Aquilonibacter sp.]
MNTRLGEGNIVRTAKRIFGFAGLACLALACAGADYAQSRPAQTQSSGVTPAATRTLAQNSPARPAAPKGQHEGITVHGHWIIEVKSPDGKVVSHREFENSLANNQGGGAALLTAMLGRTITTGSWQVFLFDGSGETNAVVINEPNSEAAAACPNYVANQELQVGHVASCSNNLSLSGPTGSGPSLQGSTVTFSGSGTVPQGFPASIGFVTTKTLACSTTDSPTACFNDTNFLSSFPLTARILDGLNGDPAAVAVTAGQTVQVTVVISFQ